MMSMIRKSVLHHYRMLLPLSSEKFVDVVDRMQKVKTGKDILCISLAGHAYSAEDCQLFMHSVLQLRSNIKVPVDCFLENRATSLTFMMACSAEFIHANPYCVIGDCLLPTKHYLNIGKFLDLIGGIRQEQLGYQRLWDHFSTPTLESQENERQLTMKWLQAVQQEMRNVLKLSRKLDLTKLYDIGRKLMSPKEAKYCGLIDSICTFEEFVSAKYPRASLEELVYEYSNTIRMLTDRYLATFFNLLELFTTQNVVIYSVYNPITTTITEILSIINKHIYSPKHLYLIDSMLGQLLNQVPNILYIAETNMSNIIL